MALFPAAGFQCCTDENLSSSMQFGLETERGQNVHSRVVIGTKHF